MLRECGGDKVHSLVARGGKQLVTQKVKEEWGRTTEGDADGTVGREPRAATHVPVKGAFIFPKDSRGISGAGRICG